MVLHFYDWIDYKGVAFSIVTRMGSHILGILGIRIFRVIRDFKP